jgi:hypothetical protein
MRLVQLASTIFEWVARKLLSFFDLLYGGIPAHFESAFGLDESVERLSAVTRDFPIFTRQLVAMGEVSRYYVSLQRPQSFRNGFAPHFEGEFREIDGRVQLTGRFTLISFAKTFMTIWFGITILFLVVALRQMRGGVLLMTMALFACGILGLGMSREGWRNDISWLSRLIQDALSDKPSAPS